MDNQSPQSVDGFLKTLMDNIGAYRVRRAKLEEADAGQFLHNDAPARGQLNGFNIVRRDHNPSANPDVDRLKELGAVFIDEVRAKASRRRMGVADRLAERAVDRMEEAVMLAVKAVTSEPEK